MPWRVHASATMQVSHDLPMLAANVMDGDRFISDEAVLVRAPSSWPDMVTGCICQRNLDMAALIHVVRLYQSCSLSG